MSLLEVGAKAPELSGVDQEGKPVRLKDYQGRKVVLYFYPKDDTPGCTAEACSLRDAHDELRESGYEVIGVSPDPEGKHRKFVDKYDLPFRLLADPDKQVIKAYGAWGPKKFMGREFEGVLRTTYLIDEGGRIARVIDKVKTKEHARQVLEDQA
ncbi:MAG: thioredoxin-dependent thiol peroxidase [Flavobacteriales bacterium]|nr:thioredoxin-dependent thiol peroxidase [Flavobacteriales bacterium]